MSNCWEMRRASAVFPEPVVPTTAMRRLRSAENRRPAIDSLTGGFTILAGAHFRTRPEGRKRRADQTSSIDTWMEAF
jgi:hypothetical protein